MAADLAEIENRVIASKNDEIALAHEIRDQARAESNRLIEENRALRARVAELDGENAGLKVTAGFFQTRSEDMEAAIKGTLGAADKRRNQGHCVLCGMTVEEVHQMVEWRLRQKYEHVMRHIDKCPDSSTITDVTLAEWFVTLFTLRGLLDPAGVSS